MLNLDYLNFIYDYLRSFGFTYPQCTRHLNLIYNLSVCSVFTYLGSQSRNSTELFVYPVKS